MAALGLVLLIGAAGPQLAADLGRAGNGALAAAPERLVPVADEAGRLTGTDARVLLAISDVECHFGHCRSGQPDGLVPPDLQRRVDRAALQPGGQTAELLGIADGRRLGDWVDPVPVAGQHAMGFMQFLPSTWRHEAPLAPGRPTDPYRPYDSMVTAGSYLARLERGAVDGRPHSLRAALAVYGGDEAYADRVLAIAESA